MVPESGAHCTAPAQQKSQELVGVHEAAGCVGFVGVGLPQPPLPYPMQGQLLLESFRADILFVCVTQSL